MTSVNFLVPADSDAELSRLRSLEVDRSAGEFVHATKVWTLQSYLILRERLDGVTCSRFPREQAINVGHCRYLRLIEPGANHFIASVSGEYRHLLWAHAHIVQNQRQADGNRYFWLPHWGQPGLVPRDEDREGVEVVGFAGRPTQLSDRQGWIRAKLARFNYGTSKDRGLAFWNENLEELGFRFRFLGPSDWHDLSDIDVLLGIRSFDREPYDYLPPSKMFNAWQAGIPFIGGNDSAFAQVGEPGRDYIRVTEPAEAIEALERLRDEPGRYRGFVEAGRARSRRYTRDRIASRWVELLTGDMQARYDEWLQENPGSRLHRLRLRRAIEKSIRRLGRLGRTVRRRGPPTRRQEHGIPRALPPVVSVESDQSRPPR